MTEWDRSADFSEGSRWPKGIAAADMSAANRFMLHVMAAVADHEAKAISERTKAALAATKARGTLLGSARPGHWEGREDARLAGAKAVAAAASKVRRESADEAYADLVPLLKERGEGLSLRAIAARLDADGHQTRRGKPWNQVQDYRVLWSGRDRERGDYPNFFDERPTFFASFPQNTDPSNAASDSASAVWHSQITSTCHPSNVNASIAFRSRALFLRNLSAQ